MTVRELMSEGVTTVDDGTTAHDAVERMMRRRVRHLAVVDKRGGLRGMVTDRDLRHYLFEPTVLKQIGSITVESLLKGAPVARMMSTPPITIEASEPLENATRLMLERKIGSLLVLDHGRLVGILTETDILRRIVGEDACCADVETIVVSYP
ncbi:MAG TPA: CBS domain-containing protein [Methylomirabilota bacterium]|jgi:acetoin utilization protein AcuB|nr:CBS domain-containing protein [Methylomirabilota bacterium]